MVTSLPELFTGVSAITLVKAPDLTIGTLFSANTFNLLNLALLDIAHRNGSLLMGVSASHRLTGWWCVSLFGHLFPIIEIITGIVFGGQQLSSSCLHSNILKHAI